MSDKPQPMMDLDIGEFNLTSKRNPNDENEKPNYYIKLSAKKEVLDLLQTGTKLYLRDPKEKFERMIKSGKLSEQAVSEVKEKMEKIPKFVLKRVIVRVPKK